MKIGKQGASIENESFSIIRKELGPNHFTEPELRVVIRMIHATGDFEYAENVRFSDHAISDGVAALRAECKMFTDVTMVQAGISSRFLTGKDARVHCLIANERIGAEAETQGITRAAAAMRDQKDALNGAIIAIGNAPTALLEVLRLTREENIRPALIIGIPVGFVNAAESKEMLSESNLSYITSLGRKGGSPVAAAVVNALSSMLSEDTVE